MLLLHAPALVFQQVDGSYLKSLDFSVIKIVPKLGDGCPRTVHRRVSGVIATPR